MAFQHQSKYFLISHPEQDAPALSDGAYHQRPYFLFVGRLEKIKGVQVLLQEFAKYKKCDLLIVGTGNYESTLKSMAAGLDHVHFLGRMAPEKLRQVYKEAVAVIVPSLCYETFGLVPLEAFSVSTPAIVNGLGALPEVVRDGGGIVYNTTEELVSSMDKLLNDRLLRNEIGQQGYANFRAKYSENIHIERYLSLVKELKERKAEVSCPVN